MADLSLKIKADFDEASRQFKYLSETSEVAQKQIESFSKKFSDDQIDKFIDKQQMAGAAITATKGSLAAAEAQNAAYTREIERLIKSGLDPNSEAVKKLSEEQKKLEKEINAAKEAQKAQEGVMKAAEAATLACIAAIGASVIAIGVMTQKTAEAGNEFAKTSRQIGMTAETFQELQYAAGQSGIKDITPHLNKLNKGVADLRRGTGPLVNSLKSTNKELLSQLENVNSNEEAFNLMMKAIKEAPDEFAKAELATAAFGKAGMEMILMAEEGADGIAALREEAKKYGVMSNEAAEASERYMDAQTRLKAAITGVTRELTAGMLPGMTDVMNGLADFIAGIDNWEDILKTAGIALAAVTAGLVTFLAVSKGHAVISSLAIAIKGLMTALTGPAGIAALAIGGLVAGIGALVSMGNKTDNTFRNMRDNLVDNKNKSDALLDAFGGLNDQKKLDADITKELIELYPELSDVLKENETTVREATEAIYDLNKAKAEEMTANFRNSLSRMSTAMDELIFKNNELKEELNSPLMRSSQNRERREILQYQIEVNESSIRAFESTISQLTRSMNNQIRDLGFEIDVRNFEIIDETRVRMSQLAEETRRAEAEARKTLQQRLNDVPMTEAQIMADRINQVRSFLQSRVDLEKVDGEDRIKAIEAERDRILRLGNIQAGERIAIERAAAEAIQEVLDSINEDSDKKEEERITDRLSRFKNMISEIEMTENQAQADRIASVESFLLARADLEHDGHNMRIEYLKEQAAQLLDNENLYADERLAIEEALQNSITKIQEDAAKAERELLESRLNSLSGFAGGYSKLFSELGKENRSFAILNQTTAAAEAGINSYLAFTKALASGPPPWNYIEAAGVLGAGIAHQTKIWQTSIPTAETGGRFVMPDISPRLDNIGLMIGGGETVNVTPRGESSQPIHIIINLEGQTFVDFTNDKLRAGEIYETSPGWNI